MDNGNKNLNKNLNYKPVDSNVHVDSILLEDGHMLHTLDDHMPGRTQPNWINLCLFIHMFQSLFQLEKKLTHVSGK